MLSIIDKSLSTLLENSIKKLSGKERIKVFIENPVQEFTRKDYLSYCKNLSQATASRDLKKTVEMGIILKNGDKKQQHIKHTNTTTNSHLPRFGF